MAKKDFDIYFSRIATQYHEMVENVKEMEQLCIDKAVAPEQLEQMKKTLQPIKDSYMNVSYIKYLLNLPKNKKIKERNKRQYKAQLEKIDSKNTEEAILNKNKEQLEKLQEITR